MSRQSRYSPEVRGRAIRMVMGHRDEYSSERAAMISLSSTFERAPEVLRTWVRRAQVGGGLRPGLTTDERQRLKDLEREVRDLRRANEILMDASILVKSQRVV